MCNPQPVSIAPAVTHYDAQPSQSDVSVTQNVYCAAYYALLAELKQKAAAGDIDDYGVSYRLRDHLLACGECRAVYDNRQKTQFSYIKNDGLKENAPNLQSGD